MLFKKEFEEDCRKKFEIDSKIGLLSSIAPDGYPHITLISSINVKDPKTFMWGQFSWGLSKEYLKDNPKTGFLVLSPDQYWWTGKALHTGSAVKGEDLEYLNNKPLFRYNSYTGFGAVHYEELVDVSAGEKLPLLKIGLGFVKSGFLKKSASYDQAAKEDENAQKLPPYGMALASALACLKFVSFIDTDGFPRLFPVMQGQTVDANRLVFAPTPFTELLRQIPSGAKTAIYLANMNLETLLLQGRWFNTEKNGRLKKSDFMIDKVYNSMLPIGGYIYPPKTLPNVYGVI